MDGAAPVNVIVTRAECEELLVEAKARGLLTATRKLEALLIEEDDSRAHRIGKR